MKSTIVSMFIILIIMIAVPLLYFGEGDFLQKIGLGDGGGNLLEDLGVKAAEKRQSLLTEKEVEVYKWVDEHGVTQFSNSPPPEGVEPETIVLSRDTNVIGAITIPEKEPEVASKRQVYNVGSPYSPGGAKKIIDTASDLQETVNQRKAEQDAAMKSMFNK